MLCLLSQNRDTVAYKRVGSTAITLFVASNVADVLTLHVVDSVCQNGSDRRRYKEEMASLLKLRSYSNRVGTPIALMAVTYLAYRTIPHRCMTLPRWSVAQLALGDVSGLTPLSRAWRKSSPTNPLAPPSYMTAPTVRRHARG